MRLSEVMHQEPLCVDVNDPITLVDRILREEGANLATVADEHRIVGVVTLLEIEAALATDKSLQRVPVVHLMTEDLVTIRSEASVDDAMETMRANQVSWLVVTEGDQFVGTVELADLPETPFLN